MEYLNLAGPVILGLHAAAVAVVNATHTPEPGTKLGKAYRVLEVIAGLVSLKAKQDGVKNILK